MPPPILRARPLARLIALFPLLSLLVLFPASAQQPSGVDFYTARDRARQTIGWTSAGCAGRPDLPEREFDALKVRLSAELDTTLRQVIGSLATPKSFSGQGEWSPGLGCGLGMDALDGIAFWNGKLGEQAETVLVTTDGILRRWLGAAGGSHIRLQNDPDAGFRDGRLSAADIYQDGWMAPFAFLAIAKPPSVDAATVFLGQGGNGNLNWPPQLLSAYVRKGERIHVGHFNLATPFAPLEACDAPRRAAESKARSAEHEQWTRLMDEALEAFNKCWDARGRDQPAFAAALRQAQSLVDDLPSW